MKSQRNCGTGLRGSNRELPRLSAKGPGHSSPQNCTDTAVWICIILTHSCIASCYQGSASLAFQATPELKRLQSWWSWFPGPALELWQCRVPCPAAPTCLLWQPGIVKGREGYKPATDLHPNDYMATRYFHLEPPKGPHPAKGGSRDSTHFLLRFLTRNQCFQRHRESTNSGAGSTSWCQSCVTWFVFLFRWLV